MCTRQSRMHTPLRVDYARSDRVASASAVDARAITSARYVGLEGRVVQQVEDLNEPGVRRPDKAIGIDDRTNGIRAIETLEQGVEEDRYVDAVAGAHGI